MSSSSFCNLYPTPWQKKMLWNAITSLSLLAIAAVVVFTLYVATQILAFLQPLLLPVAVSGVFAYLLEPVVSWLARKKVPRLLAVIIVFGAFVLGASLLAVGVIPSLYTESVKFSSAGPNIGSKIIGDLCQRISDSDQEFLHPLNLCALLAYGR
jgi:predicted PurR-regulated permease PerM